MLAEDTKFSAVVLGYEYQTTDHAKSTAKRIAVSCVPLRDGRGTHLLVMLTV